MKSKRRQNNKRLPHYIRQSIELKEKFNDNTNYFIQPYIDPDEQRKQQIQLIKQRQERARKFSSKIRKKSNKRSSKLSKLRSSKRKSSINSNDSISSILAKHDDTSDDPESQSLSNNTQTSLEQRVQILEDQLKETQRKHLHFIMRGNPTNTKQTDNELEWIFSQARNSVTNELTQKHAMEYEEMQIEMENMNKLLHEKDELIKKYQQDYTEMQQRHKLDHGLPISTAREISARIGRCVHDLGIHHNVKCDKNHDLELDGLRKPDYDAVLELDMVLLKLENIVEEVRNKPNIRNRLYSPKESWKTKSPSKHVQSLKVGEQQAVKMTAEKVKSYSRIKSKNDESSILRKKGNSLDELNQRLQKLDEELRESNLILDDMLVRHK